MHIDSFYSPLLIIVQVKYKNETTVITLARISLKCLAPLAMIFVLPSKTIGRTHTTLIIISISYTGILETLDKLCAYKVPK
jgi:hypothetical protein